MNVLIKTPEGAVSLLVDQIEDVLEIPLDSITAERLRGPYRAELPHWPGVRRLTERVSDLYQEAARRLASERGIAPVHLDTYWWGGDRRDAV